MNDSGNRDSWWKRSLSGVKDFADRNTGLLLVASSQIFGALQNVSVKTLNSLDDPVPTLELVVVRMSMTWICCIIYMHWRGVPDPFLGPKGVRSLLILRGFSGFFGLFGMYYSLNYLSLSDATVLTFLSPLTTAVAGAIILKEKFTLKEALAGACSFFGVVLIARPEFLFGAASAAPDVGHVVDAGQVLSPTPKGTPAQRLGAVGVALLGVLGATGAYTSIRAIGKRAHAMHSMVAFSAYCVVAASIGLFVQGTHIVIPRRIEWVALLLLIGFVGFIGQILMTNGLQRETAGRGTMAVYTQIIYAIAFERIFFHTTPAALSIVGTVIIMTSAIYVAVSHLSCNPEPR
ncbi:drug/metabolite transporter superfamily [Heliocybe sulcata]|uniref:Drug/metabolite transporter superfamily n=1 Tax=Heliocybe sulcata TaxID=5364 RepID=A0A5C3N4Y9_9AGAM|nr:drug/metabolite transporter superfamily [Heliocybe sulcata]